MFSYLRQVFKQSGIILFVIISTTVLEKIGGIITFFIGTQLGLNFKQSLILDVSFSSFTKFLIPDRINIILFAIAIFCMLLSGLSIYKKRLLRLDDDTVTYTENGNVSKKLLAELAYHASSGILLHSIGHEMTNLNPDNTRKARKRIVVFLPAPLIFKKYDVLIISRSLCSQPAALANSGFVAGSLTTNSSAQVTSRLSIRHPFGENLKVSGEYS